ncbi:MAG: acetate uptake transporter [Desulfovibrionaceae bacterium]
MSHQISNITVTKTEITVANPSAIGLFGLAMVTLVASSQKLGFTTGTSLIIPWALFLGAAAQVYAGMLDAKLSNVFGATAFCGYGFFWFAIGTTWMIQNGVFGADMALHADTKQLGVAFIGYLIFSLFMTFAAIETTKLLFSIFVLIDLLFIGLSLTTFGIATHLSHQLAGFSELFISILSFYGAAAVIINTQFKREYLPVGKAFGIFTR